MKKLKQKEVLGLYYALAILGNLKGVKFNYGIDKNRKRLKKEVDIIEETNKPDLEYDKYNKERVAINEKYALKNEDGTPKMTLQQINAQQQLSHYVIDEKRKAEFNKAQDDLKEKHKVAVEARKVQIEEYKEFLETENTDFSPFLISIDNIPEEITGEQFEIISNFLEEDKEVDTKE